MATLVAYTLTLAAVFFSITALPQALVGGVVGRATGPLAGGLVGSVVTWLLIDLLWLALAGSHVPIAALGGALVFIGIHSVAGREALTKLSRVMMLGEMGAIVLVGIYVIVAAEKIRWY